MDAATTSTVLTIVGFISTIASLILAVIAIWLSIVFFRMSSTLANTTTEAAKGIGASVERLEKLFDKLYSDTFSMMRDTVSDMRKHIWPESKTGGDDLTQAIEKKADEKVGILKEQMDSELTRLLHGQKTTEANIGSLRQEMRELIDKAISTSRRAEVEAQEETIRDRVVSFLRKMRRIKPYVTALELVEAIRDCPPSRLRDELKKMEVEGLIQMSDTDSEDGWTPRTKIKIR